MKQEPKIETVSAIEAVPALECGECGYQWAVNESDDGREISFEIVKRSICSDCRVDRDTN